MQDTEFNRKLMEKELYKIEAVVKALLDPSPKDDLEAVNIEVKFDAAFETLWALT